MIPTLETERLILRAPSAGDLNAFVAFYGDGEASRFVDGPKDRSATWHALAAALGCWTLRGFGEFAVEEKATGAFVGIVGPWFPEGWPEPEIAWIILPAFQKRGYGFEAAGRALAFAYETLGWKTAISLIDDANAPSAALAGKLGAVREGEALFEPYGMRPLWRHQPADAFVAAYRGRN